MTTSAQQSAPSLRIALVCPFSLSRPGGVQGQVLGLARSLRSRAHRVTVFAPVDDDAAGLPTGVDVVATGHSISLRANGSVAPVTVSARAVRNALQAIRSGSFDVVHVHEPFAPGLPYGLLVGRSLPPMVTTFHRSGRSPFYTVLRPLTRQLARRFAVRCAVSEAARSTAIEAVGGRYQLSFNGVEVDQYRGIEPWPTDGPTVLFLGRHEERKGLGVLLEAFEQLGQGYSGSGDGPSVGQPVLWISGDGPQTGSLRRRAPESAGIRWLGVLSEEEKVRRLVAADVVCAPSLGGESFGMVLLEAMAARTVVMASDIEGYRAAAGGHAVLVPPGSGTAWSEALAGVLDGSLAVGSVATSEPGPRGTPSRQCWLDEAGRWAEHWSMDRLAEWYEPVYRSAMVGNEV